MAVTRSIARQSELYDYVTTGSKLANRGSILVYANEESASGGRASDPSEAPQQGEFRCDNEKDDHVARVTDICKCG